MTRKRRLRKIPECARRSTIKTKGLGVVNTRKLSAILAFQIAQYEERNACACCNPDQCGAARMNGGFSASRLRASGITYLTGCQRRLRVLASWHCDKLQAK